MEILGQYLQGIAWINIWIVENPKSYRKGRDQELKKEKYDANPHNYSEFCVREMYSLIQNNFQNLLTSHLIAWYPYEFRQTGNIGLIDLKRVYTLPLMLFR